MPTVGAIVLAAGESSRMGEPKQLLKIEGTSLLRRAAETATQSGCSPVVVVLGCDAERMLPELASLDLHPIVNADWRRGIGSSIKCGASRVRENSPDIDAILILLVDQPFVTPGALRQLMSAFEQSGKAACVSSYGETFGPPVVVGRAFFPQLLALPDAHGAKSIWANSPGDVATFPCEEAAIDLDTPEDLARAVARIESLKAERVPRAPC